MLPRRASRRQHWPHSSAGDFTGQLAGEPIQQVLTSAPGDGNRIGGVKVVAEHGWFAARPSGTEDLYKLYAESFTGEEHLRQIQHDAQRMVAAALARERA